MVVVDQPITDPISGPSFDFTFTIGPELDNLQSLWYMGIQCVQCPRVIEIGLNCVDVDSFMCTNVLG